MCEDRLLGLHVEAAVAAAVDPRAVLDDRVRGVVLHADVERRRRSRRGSPPCRAEGQAQLWFLTRVGRVERQVGQREDAGHVDRLHGSWWPRPRPPPRPDRRARFSAWFGCRFGLVAVPGRVLVDHRARLDRRLGVVVSTSTLTEPAMPTLSALAVLAAQLLKKASLSPSVLSRYLVTASGPSVRIGVDELARRERDVLVGARQERVRARPRSRASRAGRRAARRRARVAVAVLLIDADVDRDADACSPRSSALSPSSSSCGSVLLSALCWSFSSMFALTSRSSFDLMTRRGADLGDDGVVGEGEGERAGDAELIAGRPALALFALSAYDSVSFEKIRSGHVRADLLLELVPLARVRVLALEPGARADDLSSASSLATMPTPVAKSESSTCLAEAEAGRPGGAADVDRPRRPRDSFSLSASWITCAGRRTACCLAGCSRSVGDDL